MRFLGHELQETIIRVKQIEIKGNIQLKLFSQFSLQLREAHVPYLAYISPIASVMLRGE